MLARRRAETIGALQSSSRSEGHHAPVDAPVLRNADARNACRSSVPRRAGGPRPVRLVTEEMHTGAAHPPRLLAVLVPVCAAGAFTLLWAAVGFARAPHSGASLIGLAALLAASMFAERFPVPVEGADAGGVSLLYVFVVGTAVLF